MRCVPKVKYTKVDICFSDYMTCFDFWKKSHSKSIQGAKENSNPKIRFLLSGLISHSVLLVFSLNWSLISDRPVCKSIAAKHFRHILEVFSWKLIYSGDHWGWQARTNDAIFSAIYCSGRNTSHLFSTLKNTQHSKGQKPLYLESSFSTWLIIILL